jgi:hypothetical protein
LIHQPPVDYATQTASIAGPLGLTTGHQQIVCCFWNLLINPKKVNLFDPIDSLKMKLP